jgi:hypothetical protein
MRRYINSFLWGLVIWCFVAGVALAIVGITALIAFTIEHYDRVKYVLFALLGINVIALTGFMFQVMGDVD